MFAFFSIPSLLFEKKGHGGAPTDRNSEHFKSCAINGSKKKCVSSLCPFGKRFSHTSMGSEVVCIKAFSGVQGRRMVSQLDSSLALL